MKKIGYTLLLLLSFTLLELHHLVPAPAKVMLPVFDGNKLSVQFVSPPTPKVSWFINSSEKQSIAWYVHDNGEMLVWVLVLLVVILVGNTYEIRRILIIHLIYRIFDIAMYWYDFRQSSTPYIVFYVLVSIYAAANLIIDFNPKK